MPLSREERLARAAMSGRSRDGEGATSTSEVETPATSSAPTAAGGSTTKPSVPDEVTLQSAEAIHNNQEMQHVAGATNHTRVKIGEGVLSDAAKEAHTDSLRALEAVKGGSTADKVDDLQKLKDSLAGEETERGKARLNDRIKDLEKDLTKEGKGVLRDHGKALEQAEEARKLLDKETKKLIDNAAKHRDARIQVIEDHIDTLNPKDAAHATQIKELEKQRELIRKQYKRSETAIKDFATERHDAIDEAIKNSKEVADKVEKHTGLKSEDFMSSKAKGALTSSGSKMTEAAYKDMGVTDKVKNSFGKEVSGGNKAMRAVGGVVGLGALIDGTRKVLAPKRNEQGERDGSLFAAVGEAGAGAAIAYFSLVGTKGRHIG